MIGTNFFTLSNSLSGMIHTCLSIVRNKFLGGVCLIMKLEVCSHFVMTKHVGGISVGRKLQLKSFNVVFIGQLYFGTRLSTVNIVLDANSWVG